MQVTEFNYSVNKVWSDVNWLGSLGVGLIKYITILIISVLLLCTVNAISVQAPSVVEVHDSNSFIIEITNTSNTTKDLIINFFSPAEVKILSPKSIPAHAKSSAQITLNYSPQNYTEIESKLEVYLGNELEEKVIVQKYHSKNQENNQTNNDQSGEYMGALFGLGSFVEISNFSVLEWALFIVLVIVAAILLITLVARSVKVKRRAW